MNGYLHNLVTRTLAPEARLVPRSRQIFEPRSPVAPDLEEIDETTVAESPPVARRPEVAREMAGLQDVPVLHWGSPKARARLSEAGLVVNCTPLGASSLEELPCNPLQMSPQATAVDLRYVPRRTLWLVSAAERGCTAYDGVGLLIHQAARALRFWFDVEPPLIRLREAVQWEPKPIAVEDPEPPAHPAG